MSDDVLDAGRTGEARDEQEMRQMNAPPAQDAGVLFTNTHIGGVPSSDSGGMGNISPVDPLPSTGIPPSVGMGNISTVDVGNNSPMGVDGEVGAVEGKRGRGRPRGSKGMKTLLLGLSRADVHRYKARVRNEQVRKIAAGRIREMGEVEWENLQDDTLFGIVSSGEESAGDRIKAMGMINTRRQDRKFGTREAVEATKAACMKRLGELEKLEEWARRNGVAGSVGRSDTHHEGEGETPTGIPVPVEKIGDE